MLSLLAWALLAQSHFTPAEAQAIFSQANDAYYREEWATAKEGYAKLLQHGYGGPDVLFNLGTTCLSAGELGEAVLNLERAHRLSNTPDIEANLAVARARQLDRVIGASSDEPFLQRLVAATHPDGLVWGFLSSWVVAFGLLVLVRVATRGRLLLGLGAAAAFFCALVSGSLVGAHIYVERTVSEGVVVAKELKAFELPKESAKVSFEVHAGLKVRLLESSGKFVRIRLPNGLEGWTEKEGLAEI